MSKHLVQLILMGFVISRMSLVLLEASSEPFPQVNTNVLHGVEEADNPLSGKFASEMWLRSSSACQFCSMSTSPMVAL